MVINEFIQANPVLSLAIISLAVTFVSTLAHKWLTNQEHLKNLKNRQKELQKELKNCKDECRLKEINLEIVQITGSMFKSSMRPIFVTLIPFLILFAWLRGIYGGTEPLLSYWIWYYIGFSVVGSIIFRKIFDLA
ncbi:MAG: EMC3/TMCO1 family protein [Candidatus Pacearchaeota archaeon]